MTNPQGLILAPLGALYGLATRARLALYRRGAFHIHQTGAPVISVGNITTGGTGKTPLVQWIARMLALENHRPCILTRGYGRVNPRKRVVVSDGKNILSDAREGGDEPLLLAETLLGVAAVVADADRVAAARWAKENLNTDVFILDDGFQHLRIARDLNLLTVDATNPWGGGRLLPRGRLREPLKELARADCIIITRVEQHADPDSLMKEVRRLSNGRPAILSHMRTSIIRPLDSSASGKIEPASHAPLAHQQQVPPSPIAAFCALGNPAAFFAHLRDEGYTLVYRRHFPDHHVYSQEDLDTIVREARRHGAGALLTTAKDAVKLRSLSLDLPCYVLEIEVGFDDEEKLREMIREAANSKKGMAEQV
jgi:tetraacyldisaccharide 4'-kinase